MKYIQNLLSATNDASHKRLISILSFVCIAGCLVANYCGKTIQPELIYTLFALCFGQSGLTLLDKLKK